MCSAVWNGPQCGSVRSHATSCPQLQSSQAEVTQLVAENVRMFPEMEKRLADNNALQIEVRGAARWHGMARGSRDDLCCAGTLAVLCAAGADAANVAFHNKYR